MNDVAKDETKEVKGPLTGRTLSVKNGKVQAKTDAKSGEVVDFPTKSKKNGAKAPAKTEAAPKAKEKAKEAAPAKAKKESTRGYPSDAKIKILVKENPHRKTSGDFKKYQKLVNGMTVEKALEAEVDTGYLRLLVKREVISI